MCYVIDDPIFNVQWTHNNITILPNTQKHLVRSSHNLTTLVVMDTSLEDAGEYSCVVSNVHDEEIASAYLQVQGTTLILMRIDLMFEWISIFNIHFYFIKQNKTY